MSTHAKTTVGVDACPLGWLSTKIDPNGITIEPHEEFEDLCRAYTDADRILVDIPIGFPEDERRRCDEEARELLGSRGLSVFYPPCRAATGCNNYPEANKVHKEQVGHGLSQQAYSIGEKILEVADVVGGEYDGVIREAHPELCFAALNGQPIAYSKSTDCGRGLRMKLLEDELDNAEEHYLDVREEYLLKEVRRDDILDSMVLAVAGQDSNLLTVPSDPLQTESRIYYPGFYVPKYEKM